MTWIVARCLCGILALLMVCVGGGYGADLNLARMNVTTVGGGVPVAGTVYTDCSQKGTSEFYYNGQHSSGVLYACATSATTLVGTSNDGSSPYGTATPATPSPLSGGTAKEIDFWSDRCTWTLGTGDASGTNGRVELYLWPAALDAQYFVATIYSSNNADYFQIFTLATDVVRIKFKSASTDATICDSTDTLTAGAWNKIVATYNTTSHQVTVTIGAGSPVTCTDNTNNVDWIGAPAGFRIGDDGDGNSTTSYIDDVRIWATTDGS